MSLPPSPVLPCGVQSGILDDIKQQILDGKIEFTYEPNEIEDWANTYNYFSE